MQKDERYQIVDTYFMHGLDYKGHVIEISKVQKCKTICSGHDHPFDSDVNCDDQHITFHLVTGFNMIIEHDACINDLKKVTRVVLLKPDNVFEVY